MVLSKLRMLGAPGESDSSDAPRASDGAPLTFPDLLDDNRRAWGDKIAFQQKVRREWHRISHADVYAALATSSPPALWRSDLQQGDRVVLIGENSIDWVVGYYAIVVAGGVAAPIYYDLKPAEVGEMVERADAEARVRRREERSARFEASVAARPRGHHLRRGRRRPATACRAASSAARSPRS